MPRSHRIELQGACYHVSNYAISHLPLFETQTDAENFLGILDDVHRMCKTEFFAYALMAEGYHLLLRTHEANLSSAMRYINGVYSQRYNRLRCRKGPVFCGRYKSILVNMDLYLIQVSRYIHWLPVHRGYCKQPDRYHWSSCNSYYGNTAMPSWLSSQSVLTRFCCENSTEKYQSYVQQGVDEEISTFYTSSHVSQVLGPKSFINQLQISSLSPSCRNPGGTNNAENRLSINTIVDHVEQHYDKANSKTENNNQSRNIAMALCREIGGHSLKDIARAFNVGHHRSVSMIVGRTKKKIDTDVKLSDDYHTLRDELLLIVC